jgi:hypothetical protein
MVPERADTWTRMSYAGPNNPIAPIDNPYRMFGKLYGRAKDLESLKSVLDNLKDDLNKVRSRIGAEDRRILDEHATFVREMEQDLAANAESNERAVPPLEPGVRRDNHNIPRISKQQINLLVQSFAADRPGGDLAIHEFGGPGAYALARGKRGPPRPLAQTR